MVLAEEKVKCMAEGEVQSRMRKAAVPKLQEQQRRTTALEEDDQPSVGEEMVGAEELSSARGATSGGTNRMNVLKANQQVEEALMSLNRRKQKHLHRKWKMHQRQEKPWC